METCGKQEYHQLLAECAPLEVVPAWVELVVKLGQANCSALSGRWVTRNRWIQPYQCSVGGSDLRLVLVSVVVRLTSANRQ